MSDPTEQVYDAALELPRDARAELAAILADSAEETDESPEVIEAAWLAEAKRRLAEVDAGDAELFALEDVEAELLDVIAETRARIDRESAAE
jgi:hypothetical protein